MRTLAIMLALLVLTEFSFAGENSSDNREFLKNKAAEIKGQVSAPATSSEMPPPKCGTSVMLSIFNYLQKQPDAELASILQRPENLPYSFGGAHFLIHYATSGPDSVYHPGEDINPRDGVPDYVNGVAEILERVWYAEIDSLGFVMPITDFGKGGDDRYDIYLRDLGLGYFGLTYPESLVQGYRASAYSELENDFSSSSRYRFNPLDGARVTAAHEFFHAIQFAYDVFEYEGFDDLNPNNDKPWWMEASAVWMEDVVYDDVNDYIGYLTYFYKLPWMSLTTFASGGDRLFHPYASCVWPIFLCEKYEDVGILREIWEECGQVMGYNTLPATNTSLEARGSNLGATFQEFAVWNFHTGPLADTAAFYSEGDNYPAMDTTYFVPDLSSEPSVMVPGSIQFPEQFAANYIVMDANPTAPGGVVVNFNGQGVAGQQWRAALLGYKSNDSRWRDIELNPSTGDGAGAWPGWNTYRAIVLIPTVTGLNPDNSTFVYISTLIYDSSLEGGGTPGFGVDQAYPSPFVITGDEFVSIPYSLDKTYAKKNMGLWIYDVSGQMVREIPGEQFLFTDPGEYHRGITWDGKNSEGDYVASGIYIFLFEAGDKSDRGKIAVINKRR